MTGALSITVCGEQLLLHPDRAVIWPRGKSVVVADVHFGKSGHFRRHGIAVPEGVDDTDRDRLRRLIEQNAAQRLIVLGDLLHAPESYSAADTQRLDDWARQIGGLAQIHVIAGNHDRGAPRARLSAFNWRDDAWIDGPFRFVHEAGPWARGGPPRRFTLSGHVHPVAHLGRTKARLRVPVFWLRESGLVLPSFGVFTGGFAVRAGPGEQLYAVSSDAVRGLRP